MQATAAPYSLFQKQQIRNEAIAQKLQQHLAVEARKRVHERLLNWASWHKQNNINEMDSDSGAIKVNTLSRLIKSVQAKVSGFDVDEYEPPSEVDAVAVQNAIYSLGSGTHDNDFAWLIQMLYIEQLGYTQIASETKWTETKVKGKVRALRDRMVSLLGA